MLAVDTNIVVRYLVGDGSVEFAKSVNIIESNQVSIAPTVLLEAEWVLRDLYALARRDVPSAFERFVGLPTVSVSEPGAVRKAMALADSGQDFADALHLAQVVEQEAFVTFDKALAKRTKRFSDNAVRLA
jgi:predicted nucleic-acid-binding protein